MLDTEQSGTPDTPSESDGGWAQVLTEVDSLPSESPTPVAGSSPETPSTPPAGTPARISDAPAGPEGEGTPQGTPEGTAAAPTGSTETPPAAPTSLEVELEGKKLSLAGAKEDGENYVIPKATFTEAIKSHVTDTVNRLKTDHGRERANWQQSLQKVQQQQGAREATAQRMIDQLDKIMGLAQSDPAASFEEWEKFATGYAKQKTEAEKEYWREQATGQQATAEQRQAQQEAAEYLPFLQGKIREWAGQAVAHQKAQLEGMSEAELKDFQQRVTELLLEDADAGRLFFNTGERIPGTTLPRLEPNFQRLAQVVEREVGAARKALETIVSLRKTKETFEAAARKNAEAEAKRLTQAPPAVRGKVDAGIGVGSAKDPKSFDDILADIDKM